MRGVSENNSRMNLLRIKLRCGLATPADEQEYNAGYYLIGGPDHAHCFAVPTPSLSELHFERRCAAMGFTGPARAG